MQVTSLVLKNGRVQIFIDGNYAFSASSNFVIDNILFKGKQLTSEEIDDLKYRAGISILKIKLIEYITGRALSPKELYRKISLYAQRKFGLEIDQDVFKKQLDEAINSRLYDQVRVINNLVTLYISRKKGKGYINSKLNQKGFDKLLIEEALSMVSGKDFDENLKAFLEKKRDTLSNRVKDKYDLKQRLIKAGLGRGYSYSQIIGILKILL